MPARKQHDTTTLWLAAAETVYLSIGTTLTKDADSVYRQ